MVACSKVERLSHKELRQRGFLEGCDADDLKDFVQTGLQFPSFLQNRDEQVSAHGGPDLDAHRILRVAHKTTDTEMLLDPAEEQLDLPARPIQLRDLQSRSREQVGEENQRQVLRRIAVADPAQRRRITPLRGVVAQLNGLIAAQPSESVDWPALCDVV